MGGTTFALGCPCNRFKIKWIEFFRPLNLAKASAPMQFWSTASTRKPKGWGAAACDLNVADLDFSPAQCDADKSVPGKIRPTTPSPPRPHPPRIPRLRLVSATLNRPHSPAALAVQSPHPCPTAW